MWGNEPLEPLTVMQVSMTLTSMMISTPMMTGMVG
jgi:hypothetical protein